MSILLGIKYHDGIVTKHTHDQVYDVINFPSGEVHVRLKESFIKHLERTICITFLATDVKSPKDVFIVQLLKNAICNLIGTTTTYQLLIAFFPSARQDRVAVLGDANSLQVYGEFLTKGFDTVSILDPHSHVCEMFSSGSSNCTQVQILAHGIEQHNNLFSLLTNVAKGYTRLVAPDIGALKKTEAIAKRFMRGGRANQVAACHKERDPMDGSITGYSVLGDVKGFDCLITDDICDGGFTFTSCAKLLYEKGASSVSLYVTHGLFTKGFKDLKDCGIKHIYTTNSVDIALPSEYSDYVTIIDIKDFI